MTTASPSKQNQGRRPRATRSTELIVVRALRLALAVCAASTTAYGAPMPPAPIVFFDIAGADMAKQAAFYRDVFGWESGPGGTLKVPVLGGALSGALRQDPQDKILYLGVEDVTAALAKVEAHGGKIVRPRFAVKGVVVIGLFTDPAGNSMGLVEMQGDKPKIP